MGSAGLFTPPPGMNETPVTAGGGGLYGGSENPAMTQWRAGLQQHYNQINSLGNLLNHVSSSPFQYGQHLSDIAGGYYLRLLGSKDPVKEGPAIMKEMQPMLQAYYDGLKNRQDQQSSSQSSSIVQPSSTTQSGQTAGGMAGPMIPPPPGAGPAALPAAPSGEVGPPPSGFSAQGEPMMQSLAAMAYMPKAAELQASGVEFEQQLNRLTNGRPELATPQQRLQATMLATPRQLGYMPGAFFTAGAAALKAGFNLDGSPLNSDQMSELQKSRVELQQSQKLAADAKALSDRALADARTNPNNAQLQLKWKTAMAQLAMAGARLQQTQMRTALMERGIDLRQMGMGFEFDPDLLTEQQKSWLPTNEAGQPIPTRGVEFPTAQTRQRAQFAGPALEHMPNLRQMIRGIAVDPQQWNQLATAFQQGMKDQDVQGSLGALTGPLVGRFNELMTRKVGSGLDPKTGQLFSDMMTTMDMMTTAVAQAHGGGARKYMLDHFMGMLRPNMTREVLDGSLNGMQRFLTTYQQQGQSGRTKEALAAKTPKPPPGATATQQFAEGQTATGPNGHKIKFAGGKWTDASTGQPIQ